MTNKLGIRAMEDGVANLGVSEEPPGSNRGQYVDQYIRFCGLEPPQFWCACFVSFRVHKAANALGLKTIWPKSASCQLLYEWAKRRGLVHDRPQVGDAFVVYHTDVKRYAHIGLVRSVGADGKSFTTVEGNSNDNGSRNGTKVASNTRLVSKKIKFITIQ